MLPETLRILLVSSKIRSIVASKIHDDVDLSEDELADEIQLWIYKRAPLPTMDLFLTRVTLCGDGASTLGQSFTKSLVAIATSPSPAVRVAVERVAAAVVFCDATQRGDACPADILLKIGVVCDDDETGTGGTGGAAVLVLVLVLRPRSRGFSYQP